MAADDRWSGIERTYTAEDVVRLRGSVVEEHTLARLGAERLWELLRSEKPVRALGALTGGQAVQMVRAGLEAIYLSGWQVAADANLAGATYPDQSLYPVNSVPAVVRRLNNALLRADQIDCAEGRNGTHWLAPILADAEAGFGGPLNAFELMRAMIEAGAAGVHYEDQLSSEKKCGHLGGKVLVADAAVRPHAQRGPARRRRLRRADGARRAHGRALGGAPHERRRRVRPRLRDRRADGGGLLPRPRRDRRRDLARARVRAVRRPRLVRDRRRRISARRGSSREAIHERFPGKPLAYNCSPSFNWRRHLDDDQIASFQETLGEWGYRFLFITLAGFHSLNASMFELARGYAEEQMPAYVRLQEREFELEEHGYTATRHQHEVGAGYFDLVTQAVAPESETLALKGSTEEAQFTKETV